MSKHNYNSFRFRHHEFILTDSRRDRIGFYYLFVVEHTAQRIHIESRGKREEALIRSVTLTDLPPKLELTGTLKETGCAQVKLGQRK